MSIDSRSIKLHTLDFKSSDHILLRNEFPDGFTLFVLRLSRSRISRSRVNNIIFSLPWWIFPSFLTLLVFRLSDTIWTDLFHDLEYLKSLVMGFPFFAYVNNSNMYPKILVATPKVNATPLTSCSALINFADWSMMKPVWDSQTRPWKRARVAGDLVVFCEPDENRFELSEVFDTSQGIQTVSSLMATFTFITASEQYAILVEEARGYLPLSTHLCYYQLRTQGPKTQKESQAKHEFPDRSLDELL